MKRRTTPRNAAPRQDPSARPNENRGEPLTSEELNSGFYLALQGLFKLYLETFADSRGERMRAKIEANLAEGDCTIRRTAKRHRGCDVFEVYEGSRFLFSGSVQVLGKHASSN